MSKFPIDLSGYRPLKFEIGEKLNSKKLQQLKQNIQLVRDSIVFFTAYANAKGIGGHTGGAYDITPEVLIIDALTKGSKGLVPGIYDEAGHRVAIQYMMSALNGHMSVEKLMHYREFDSKLPGHPERGFTPGIEASSGRLGHIAGYANGIAEQNKGKKLVMFGSDGAQQEGDDAEAARYAVSHNLGVLWIIDDNNVTIEGHPHDYMKGFDAGKTLTAYGFKLIESDGEDIERLYSDIQKAMKEKGPVALINKREMIPGVKGVEGTTKGHDAIPVDAAINYLEGKGYEKAVDILKGTAKTNSGKEYLGSSEKFDKNRSVFGDAINEVLEKDKKQIEKVIVVSNDLGGSCGLNKIEKKFPQVYKKAGIMERNNFLVAAGFGSKKGYQGIYATFSAFQEMIISEITMSRLNDANVIAHFSHSGVDDMADNTCHFGINNFFSDNGVGKKNNTKLYFPADANQMKAVVEKVFYEEGLRFVYSTRSATPFILDEKGDELFGKGYKFSGKDEIIREGKDGYIVSYGEMLYRSLDAALKLKKEGIDVGLVNKPCLNVIDEDMMKKLGKSKFVIVVESQNRNTGLGMRFGTWLLERGFNPKYEHLGVTKEGNGGLSEQIDYQELDSESIQKKVKEMVK